jgi:nicotinamide-nucleotide amidase
MFDHAVVPLLKAEMPLSAPFACRTLRSTGIGESQVEERIDGPLQSLLSRGLELGYCAATGAVDVRLSARGTEANELVQQAEQIVRNEIGPFIYGVDDDLLESVDIRLLSETGRTVAVAESCTGGFLAHRITNVPGSSAVFLGGLVTYSNSAKEQLLGVPPGVITSEGAVSEPTARAMAEGARLRLGADYGVSLTGIAGPTGGTTAKPVGTVFIGLATPKSTYVKEFFNQYDRETFKLVSSQQALDLLRRELGKRNVK